MAKAATKNPNALDGDIIVIRRGLAIYKRAMSPYYLARILNPNKKPKYVVKSTRETSRVEARRVAEEIALDIQRPTHKTVAEAAPAHLTLDRYADVYLREAMAETKRGNRSPLFHRDARQIIENEKYGIRKYLGKHSVIELTSRDIAEYFRSVIEDKAELSSSTHNKLRSTLRGILNVALYDGVINALPQIPKLTRSKQTPRPFFRFRPIVPYEKDQYALIRRTAKKLADEKHEVRGIPITIELYCLIVFATNTFVRPTISELYALRHTDVAVQDNPKALSLIIARGKTGYRPVISMPAAVNIYEMLRQHNSEYLADSDYLFLPKYKNRTTARNIMMRQFNYLLRAANLEQDEYTELKHSLYSLRHTAICMRMVLSHGSINLDILARNAGTSIQMLQDFYMKYLPITPEMARNLQSFGSKGAA